MTLQHALLLLAICALHPLSLCTTLPSLSFDLELQHPRPSTPNSRHGFPATVHVYTPPLSARLPRSLARLLGTHRTPYTAHAVAIDLLGGITKVGEYYTRVVIGGQPVRVQVDTGSSTFALPLAECDRCLPSDQRYNRKLSRSGKAHWISCVNELCKPDTCSMHGCRKCSAHDACCSEENGHACGFFLKYGDGSLARGGLMVDEMHWGNVSASVVFGGILHDSKDFERPLVDGILGMAYKALACNPTCVEPPFQQMVQAGVVEDSFSICITGQGGKLVLGKFDDSLAKGPLKYVPLALSDPPSFYTMNISNHISVDGRSVGIPNLRAGILDSGTTLIVVSQIFFLTLLDQLAKFHCDIPGLCHTSKPWFMPTACVKIDDETLAKLPTIVLHLGSNGEFDMELRPQDYMLPVQKPGHQNYRCVGIMAMKQMQEGTDIILGNTVMRRYVSNYDRKNKRLGFAEAVEGCGGATQCSSYTQCIECASVPGCSYNFKTELCQPRRNGIGLIPYPECHGEKCLCNLGRQAGLVFGLVDGFIGSLVVMAIGVFVVALYSRRRGSDGGIIGSGGDHEPIYTVTDDEDYDESREVGQDGERPQKGYVSVPSE